MANAFSVPVSYGQYIQPINTNLVNTVLNAKQKTYDYNVAKVDGLIQQYTNLPLLREQDKDYLKGRIDSVLNVVNHVSKLDLSDNNLTRKIEGTIATAIDDNVLEQMANSRKILDFEQSIAQKREKHPELYSDVNYTYAKQMAGYNEYMSGEKNTINTLQYADYKDVNKRVNDFIIDIQNKKKDQVVQIPVLDANGQRTGTMQETTISGLTPFQVKQLAESQLDSTYDKQIEINGWFHAGGYGNTDKINSDVDTVIDYNVKNNEAKRAQIERQMNVSGISPQDKAAYQAELDGILSENKNLQTTKDFLMKNPAAGATFLERQKVIADAQDAFGSLYSQNTKIVKDEIYFAEQDLNLKKLKLQYDIEKDRETKADKLAGSESIISTIPTPTDDLSSVESYINKDIEKYTAVVDSGTRAYRAALEDAAKTGNKDATNFLAEYNKKVQASKGKTADQVFSEMINTIDYNSPLTIVGNKNYISEIKDSKERLELLLNGKNQAMKESETALVDATINSESGLKAFYENPETKMLYNGKAVPVKDVLISKGIIDSTGKKIGDLKSNPEVLKSLQQSFYADDALSNADNYGIGAGGLKSLRKLVQSFGENPSMIKSREVATGGAGNPTKTIYYVQGGKSGAFLMQAQKNGIYDTFGWSDQSLSHDDSTIGKYITEGDYHDTDLYRNNLKKFYSKLPSTQLIGIVPQDKQAFGRILNIANSQPNSNFVPDKNATLNLRLDGDYVIISQNQEETINKSKQVVNKQTSVLKSDFVRAAPELSSKLDFSTEAAFYSLENLQGKPLVSESVKYFDSNTSRKNYLWSTQVLLSSKKEWIPYLSEGLAKQSLYNSNKILEQRYSNFSSIVDNALKQSSNYAINAVVEQDYNGNPYIDMKLVDKKTQVVIHSVSDSNQINIDNFKSILDNAPQVFYSIMLNDIMAREREEMMMGSKSMSTAFQNLTDSLK